MERSAPSAGLGLVTTAVLLLATLSRGFRAPVSYALGYWLLSYDHGFLKRGLVGTLTAPLLAWKTANEGRFALQTVATVVTLGVVAAVVASVRPLLQADVPTPTRWALRASIAALATSAWVVFAGHTNGFLDRWLELTTLTAVALVGSRWRGLVPLLAVIGVAIHEMFLVYGLPVITLAVVIHAAPGGLRRVARHLAVLGAPVLAVSALLALAPPAPEAVAALRDDIAATGVIDDGASDNAVFYLTHDVAENASLQRTGLWDRVRRADLAIVAAPPVALFLLWAVVGLWSSARRLIGLLPLAFTPLLLHLVAWDTPRFTILVVFQAFVAWLAVSRATPLPPLGRWAWVLLGFGLLVTVHNVVQSVPLMEDERDGDAPLSVRAGPSLRSFTQCTPIFPNADFESGSLAHWTATGSAFTDALRPVVGVGGRLRGTLGKAWLGTYTLAPNAGGPRGDAPTGELVSQPFLVRANPLLFTIGGGYDPDALRVSVQVDGVEVAWATGADADTLVPHAWDLSAWRGRMATITVRDHASGPWGHLNVDGFCWFGKASASKGKPGPPANDKPLP